MAYFVVIYAVREGFNYRPLVGELERMGAVPFNDVTWLVDQNATVSDLFNVLQGALPTTWDDKLLVIPFVTKPCINDGAGPNLNGGADLSKEWVQARFPS